jgi:hypothetical protein
LKQNLFIFVVALIVSMPNSNANELGEEEPTGIFNALFLGRENTTTFSYAPWGNRSEENATIQNIRIGSGGFYSKFAYYGKSPLRLLGQPTENQESAEPLEITYSFQSAPRTREEVLMIKRSDKGGFKAYPIDFSKSKIPLGSILFQSYSNQNIFISIGEKKFILESGKSNLYKADSTSKSNIYVNGYLRSDEKLRKVFKQMVRNVKLQRGMILLRTQGSTIKSMNLMEHASQNEKIIGLGSQPFTPMPLPPEPDEASNPRLEAFPKEN